MEFLGDKLESAGEASALLDGRAQSNQTQLICCLFVAVLATVWGTYYWFAILPAWEQDAHLHWTVRSSKLAATSSLVAEFIGLVSLGTVADHVSASTLLSCNALFMMAATVVEILGQQTWVMICATTSVCLFKSVAWPAVTVLTSQNITPSYHDCAFLLFSMASRLGDVIDHLVLGGLMGAPLDLNWNQATAIVLLMLALLFLSVWSFWPRNLNEAVKETTEIAPLSFTNKFQRLIFSTDAWLVWFITIGSGLIWSLDTYFSLLLVDLYDISPGSAASYSSAIDMGMLAGMAVAVTTTGYCGPAVGRALHVGQAFIGGLALGGLAYQPLLQLHQTLSLAFLGGFGAVVPCYLPALAFSARSPPTERGFRLGMLWGTLNGALIGMSYLFGSFRENCSSRDAASWMYAITCAGLLLAAVAMACRIIGVKKDKSESVATN